jgi:uncharacterized protein
MRAPPLLMLAAVLAAACGGQRAAPASSPASSASPPPAIRVPAMAEEEDAKPEPKADVCTDAPATPRAIAPKLPFGYDEMTVERVSATPGAGGAVILVDADRTKAVAIYVGGTEATSISVRNAHEKYVRPLTHDLLDTVLERFGGRVIAARVDSIENNVFIGTLMLQKGERALEIDARASDAIAMAIGARAPIYVARTVIARAGVPPSELLGPEPAP